MHRQISLQSNNNVEICHILKMNRKYRDTSQIPEITKTLLMV